MADGSWVGITNVHLPQELTTSQIPAVGENTNSDSLLITVTPLCRTDMGLVPHLANEANRQEGCSEDDTKAMELQQFPGCLTVVPPRPLAL